ncbi:PREDICTED: cadherin-like protein 26 [Chrysochloris asiatica]|uniref:Cadherin-like protein 26 n=1 Tax=Chrysochloris asiatica TaxID=185453 RepID=A0A9B0U0E2_CHRAS|nr:PREDICTED: cadherin-like protein 26 [Chrysochloris asiatica]
MDSREHTFLLLALLPPMLLLLQVNIANSFQQERDNLTNQIKGESHRPLHRFKRRWIITTLELEEEDPGPFPKLVGELFNNMSDSMSLLYLISGPGVDEYPEIGLFSIEDHKNGKIYVHRPIDRETTSSFMVRFDVVDRSTGDVVDKSLFFSIRVSDVNDHAPQFLEEKLSITVKESQEADLPIFQMLTVDLDQKNTPNSQVLYSLVSQTPLLKESSFLIDQRSGKIQLSGCLDYETAPLFTLLIRARDLGKPPLSSTATVHVHVQDDNNHRPVFTQDSYKLQIPEGQVSPGVLRLPVRDQDSPFTSAWRAKFNISKGDEDRHFDISTDPETNEGILSVVKPLDYESLPARKLVISVENEAQLFSCEGGKLRKAVETRVSVTVNVEVMDINDPPAFHPGTLVVSGQEGGSPGLLLGMFNATDPDRISSHISYKLVHDPENWVTVDENSGAVTTRKQTDRESPHVKDSFYTIVVHAIDDGLPPQTGTGTLMLHLSDVNDHAPSLRQPLLQVCASAGRTSLRIDAVDPDLEPNADPFTFELDDADGTWELGKNWGRSVELLMVRSLPSGNYSVPLRIGDQQGLSQKQTVYVRVCSCPGGVTCAQLAANTAGVGLPMGMLIPVCVAFLVLAVALLSLLRCYFAFEAKKSSHWIRSDDTGVQTLIMYNQESKAVSTQVCTGVGDPTVVLQVNTAVGGARPGAKDVNEKPPLMADTSGLLHAAVEILFLHAYICDTDTFCEIERKADFAGGGWRVEVGAEQEGGSK